MNENDFVYSLNVEQRKAYWELKKNNFKEGLTLGHEIAYEVAEALDDVENASGAHSVRHAIENRLNYLNKTI